MAKKKPTGKAKAPPADLTPEQYRELGERMTRGGGGNVYTVVRVNYGISGIGDEVFDGLKAHAGVEKCVECDLWKYSPEMVAPGLCDECG